MNHLSSKIHNQSRMIFSSFFAGQGELCQYHLRRDRGAVRRLQLVEGEDRGQLRWNPLQRLLQHCRTCQSSVSSKSTTTTTTTGSNVVRELYSGNFFPSNLLQSQNFKCTSMRGVYNFSSSIDSLSS